MARGRFLPTAAVLLAVTLLFSSCAETVPGDPTDRATLSRSSSTASSVTVDIPEPEPETEPEEESDTDEKEKTAHTYPTEKKKNSDILSAISEYESTATEKNLSSVGLSAKERLDTFLTYSSPLDLIRSSDGTLVYPYIYGRSSRELLKNSEKWYSVSDADLYAVPSDISVFYYDLLSGDEYGFNENEVRDSASLAKIPYLLAVLEETAAFESQFDGEPDYSGENAKYDLSAEWVYDSATMFKYGSGVLFEKPDGTVCTIEELFSLSFRNSDNIAYAQLKERFGYQSYYDLLARLGIDVPSPDERFLTAREYGVILAEAYRFISGGSRLGEFMKNEMESAILSSIIAMSYPPKTVAHKYGWDVHAYHDMGIVFEENPYIIVIMTDCDTGGYTVDSFFGDIVRHINELRSENRENLT